MRFYLIAIAAGIIGLLVTGKVVPPEPIDLLAENRPGMGSIAFKPMTKGG